MSHDHRCDDKYSRRRFGVKRPTRPMTDHRRTTSNAHIPRRSWDDLHGALLRELRLHAALTTRNHDAGASSSGSSSLATGGGGRGGGGGVNKASLKLAANEPAPPADAATPALAAADPLGSPLPAPPLPEEGSDGGSPLPFSRAAEAAVPSPGLPPMPTGSARQGGFLALKGAGLEGLGRLVGVPAFAAASGSSAWSLALGDWK